MGLVWDRSLREPGMKVVSTGPFKLGVIVKCGKKFASNGKHNQRWTPYQILTESAQSAFHKQEPNSSSQVYVILSYFRLSSEYYHI